MKKISLTKLLFNKLRCTESKYNISELNKLLTNQVLKIRDFN